MTTQADLSLAQLREVAAHLVRRVGVGRGEDVLDVACGTGNTAMRAVLPEGRVTGVDITPDAEHLPYPDESFDLVFSIFAVTFAPRHRDVAIELTRVLRPGGRFCVTAWTPLGWGSEDHVREIFTGARLSLEFDRESVATRDYLVVTGRKA
jgi:ubiquinone/menaquinone biosynthesis C-methylase UbiE